MVSDSDILNTKVTLNDSQVHW